MSGCSPGRSVRSADARAAPSTVEPKAVSSTRAIYPRLAPDLLAFTSLPQAHWRKIWSTNPLERLNGEIKRRSRVVGISQRRGRSRMADRRGGWVPRRVRGGGAALPVRGIHAPGRDHRDPPVITKTRKASCRHRPTDCFSGEVQAQAHLHTPRDSAEAVSRRATRRRSELGEANSPAPSPNSPRPGARDDRPRPWAPA